MRHHIMIQRELRGGPTEGASVEKQYAHTMCRFPAVHVTASELYDTWCERTIMIQPMPYGKYEPVTQV